MTTLTLIIIANVVLDIALLAGLAFAMTRPAKLTPHRPGVTGNVVRLRRPLRQDVAARRHEPRAARRLSAALH
jgi:hypothetical protein